MHKLFHDRPLVETAIISYDLHINLPLGEGFTLFLKEEYQFSLHKLKLHSYSYNLLEQNGNSVIRSDNLPYHQTDYKGHQLTHPPHHVHDKLGRISSFTGDLEDFINLVKETIEALAKVSVTSGKTGTKLDFAI